MVGTTLLAGGLTGLTLGVATPAGADNSGTPVCGPSVAISTANTSTSPLTTLTVPQYNGAGTLTAAQLSIQPTETFSGSFIDPNTFQPTPGTATQDYNAASSVLEVTGPGLSALSGVSVGTPVNGSPMNWSAGTPLPALPSGVAAAEGTGGAGVSTGTTVDVSWTALGFPFLPGSPAPATDHGTVTFSTTAPGSISPANFASYTGNGNVSLQAADYAQYFSSADFSFNGINDSTSVQACVTYSVLGAQTPEAPSALLLPAAAAAVGLGGFMVVRRRNRRANPA